MNKAGSVQNLKPLKKGDPRCAELQAKGTIVRKQNSVKRQKMRDELNTLLKLSLQKGDLILPEEVTSLAEAKDLNIPVQTAINIAMIQRAIMGDVQAATWVRDTLGEKPTDKVELDQSLTIEAWAKNHDVKL
ncbi:MAG: hypothetical protein IKG65_08065 [Exiguobacterium sp.]|nr:hypothetical protein [Exiguobacterium sp.]